MRGYYNTVSANSTVNLLVLQSTIHKMYCYCTLWDMRTYVKLRTCTCVISHTVICCIVTLLT